MLDADASNASTRNVLVLFFYSISNDRPRGSARKYVSRVGGLPLIFRNAAVLSASGRKATGSAASGLASPSFLGKQSEQLLCGALGVHLSSGDRIDESIKRPRRPREVDAITIYQRTYEPGNPLLCALVKPCLPTLRFSQEQAVLEEAIDGLVYPFAGNGDCPDHRRPP